MTSHPFFRSMLPPSYRRRSASAEPEAQASPSSEEGGAASKSSCVDGRSTYSTALLRSQPLECRRVESLRVQGRVVHDVELPIPASCEREPGTRNPVRLPVGCRRHDLDPVS